MPIFKIEPDSTHPDFPHLRALDKDDVKFIVRAPDEETARKTAREFERPGVPSEDIWLDPTRVTCHLLVFYPPIIEEDGPPMVLRVDRQASSDEPIFVARSIEGFVLCPPPGIPTGKPIG